MRTLWYNIAMKNETTSTKRTTETVTISSAEYERLKRENEQLEGRVRWLEEQLKVLAKNHFGSKHETASEEVIGQMAMLFDEPELYAHLEEIEQESVAAPEKTSAEKKKKRAFILDKLPENAEVKVAAHQLSEAERICPVCGAVMQPVGEEVVRTLEIIPARFVVHEDHYENYKCTNCTGEDSEEEVGKTQFAKTYGAEICHGQSALQDGDGLHAQRHRAFPSDDVQLDDLLCRDLAYAALRKAPSTAASGRDHQRR